MMRSAGGALAVTVVLLFAVCRADSHPEQDVEHASGERFDSNGHKSQNVEAAGSRSLLRQARESRSSSLIPQYLFKQYDFVSPYSGRRELWPAPAFTGYNGDGLPKRNFDEIDRSNMNTFVRKRNFDEIDQTNMPFVRKRNFDEIDQTNMPFPFATKRFYSLLRSNVLDGPLSSYDKTSARRQFDEIDRSNFPFGSKRSMDSLYYDPRAI